MWKVLFRPPLTEVLPMMAVAVLVEGVPRLFLLLPRGHLELGPAVRLEGMCFARLERAFLVAALGTAVEALELCLRGFVERCSGASRCWCLCASWS